MELLIKKLEYLQGLDGGGRVIITLPRALKTDEIAEIIKEIDGGRLYKAEIKRRTAKRSLTSNSYLWVLLERIAEVLSRERPTSKEDIYKGFIHDYGVFSDQLVKNDICEQICAAWQSNGVGWLAEVDGVSKKYPDFSVVRFYIGTSQYNQVQMSRILNAVVAQAQELNIEVYSPEKLEKLVKEWGLK